MYKIHKYWVVQHAADRIVPNGIPETSGPVDKDQQVHVVDLQKTFMDLVQMHEWLRRSHL